MTQGKTMRSCLRHKFRFCISLIALALIAISAARPAHSTTGASASESWDALAGEFFEQAYFKFSPTSGTAAGFHQYDSALDDYTAAGVRQNVEVLRQFEKRVESVDPKGLDETRAADRQIVLSTIRAELLSLQTIRPWEKNPDTYSSGVIESIYVIMSRRYAPPDERLRSVVARESQIPAALAAARENLKNPPRIFTEIALEQLPDTISFFQNDVPAAFSDAKDAKLQYQFQSTNAAVIAALKNYADWLRSDLLPRSNGDFRLGPETFSKKLLYEEMVDIPLDNLVEIGRADLRKNQAEFTRIAKEADPSKTPQQVLAELQADHPAPDHLLQSFRDTFDGLVAFIRKNHIITIPSDVRPTLQETPPFERATTFASMDTPGPYETHSTQAYFNVTLPPAGATPKEIEGYMAEFNVGTIVSTSVHEAFPGHFVQFLWVPQAPTKVRKLLGASSNAEGWAHYCEQMMLDEGFGQPGTGAKDEHEAKLIRLGQLQDALLRDARFVVGVEMHRNRMTFEQAVEFFQKEGYQSPEAGLVETKRGTSDATYLYYTLGKLQIMKLREDLKKKQGASFSLEQFHNDFMRQGFPPIAIVRHAMLGDNSPTLAP
jgi:uncharacterized protein (DUF885 family)